MRIVEHRALRGPNLHDRHPVVRLVLDASDVEGLDSARVPGFVPRLLKLLPGLAPAYHERLERGASLPEVVARVAGELQRLAGMDVGVHHPIPARDPGAHLIIHRYHEEESALQAGRDALALVQALLAMQPFDVAAAVDDLRALCEANAPGPSTAALLDEARRRGIPLLHLDEGSHWQLGHGARQQRIQATMTGRTSGVGVEIADDKARTKRLLARHGIPVPEGTIAATPEGAQEIAAGLGYPVVTKPLVGNHGRGITVGIRGPEELAAAFAAAKAIHRSVLVEKVLPGADHRLLVIDHRFVAAARRDPPRVVGDGRSTVQQLVDQVNEDPRRGKGHEKAMTRIHVDDGTRALLATQGLALGSVPAAGAVVVLKTTANLSSGGSATDVTDDVHPAVRAMAERVSRLVGLDVCGIDVVAPHLRRPLPETGGGICEVNAAPGFRMHLAPSAGKLRNVAAPVLDMLFPHGATGTIPIVAVTGTNGKTTTVRLISHLLRANGARVGMTCTNGVEIHGQTVVEGDYSGPGGAEAVLTDPTVDHAVFEVARGGILRRGLGFETCDVGVLLNVAGDHLGEGGIDTLDDLASLKGIVLGAVKPGGTLVLNAEDPRCLRLRDDATRHVILFSLDPRHEAYRQHVEEGGQGVTVVDGAIVLQRGAGEMHVAHLHEVPLALQGKAHFNVQNAMAALAAAHALGVAGTVLAHAVTTFAPTVAQLPGRMNLVDVGRFKVLVDYGHNPPALRALGDVLPHLAPARILNVASGTGNRREEDLRELGAAIATLYDHVILCDPDPRGRSRGVTPELVRQGMVVNGFREDDLQVILDEDEAIRTALAMAQPGDLVVLQVDDVRGALAKVAAWKSQEENASELPPEGQRSASGDLMAV